MARTREFEPGVALDRGMHVFWDKGYADTSMDDLVNATGVSRYGLYGTFGNKREFFVEALNRYAHGLLEQGFGALNDAEASLPELREILAQRIAEASRDKDNKGCMICNTATELAAHDEVIAAAVRDLFKQLAGRFQKVLKNAQDKGEIRADLDTNALGLYMVGVIQGLAVMARAGIDQADADSYLDTALNTLI